jgi:hypothetical protein
MGKHPSVDWAARDTAQSTDNRVATSVYSAAEKHIPSCRGLWGMLVMDINNLEPLRLKRLLVNHALTLFLYRYPSSFSRGRFCHQAQNFLLDCVSSSTHSHELTF